MAQSKAARAGTGPYNIWQAFFPVLPQQVAIGAGSVASSVAFAGSVAEFFATADCFISFGTAPTATTSTVFLAAGIYKSYAVSPGDKVAVIQKTGAGTLYIQEGSV